MKKVDVEKIVPVFALEISDIVNNEDGTATLTFVDGSDINDKITIPSEYIQKYSPKIGGFYIMCSNGVGLYSEA